MEARLRAVLPRLSLPLTTEPGNERSGHEAAMSLPPVSALSGLG